MNIQALIREIERDSNNKPTQEDYWTLFYPVVCAQRQADKNITRCLRELKW